MQLLEALLTAAARLLERIHGAVAPEVAEAEVQLLLALMVELVLRVVVLVAVLVGQLTAQLVELVVLGNPLLLLRRQV